jgi:FimV-like protein
MAKKRITRKELLKDTDEFITLSARAANFVSEHTRKFQYAGIAVVVIILIYLGINTYMGYVDKKGQEAFNVAIASFTEEMKTFDTKKTLKGTEEGFKKVEDKYGLSQVSWLVPPELAYIKYLEKKYDEAISLYQAYLKELKEGSPYQSLTRLALAACYEEKGELDKAAEVLNKILAAPKDTFKEQAMLSLARVYRLNGKTQESVKMLKEFLEKYKSSPFVPLAKAHLEQYSRS